jgi:hypothetical protein
VELTGVFRWKPGAQVISEAAAYGACPRCMSEIEARRTRVRQTRLVAPFQGQRILIARKPGLLPVTGSHAAVETGRQVQNHGFPARRVRERHGRSHTDQTDS